MYLHISDRKRKIPQTPVLLSINYSFLLFAKLMRNCFIYVVIRMSATISVWSLLHVANVNTMRNLILFVHIVPLVFNSGSISGSDVINCAGCFAQNWNWASWQCDVHCDVKVSKYGKWLVTKQENIIVSCRHNHKYGIQSWSKQYDKCRVTNQSLPLLSVFLSSNK